MEIRKVLCILSYFFCGFLCRTWSDVPRNLSEGLIFCCANEEVEVKKQNSLLLSDAPPATQRVPSATSTNLTLYVPPGVVPQDYHQIHVSIPIRSRRQSERECLKLTQPSRGCFWYFNGNETTTYCRNFVLFGTPALPGEFPYVAAIGFASGNDTVWVCGGTLISLKFVLTAAHCAFSRQTGSPPSVVRLGAHNVMEGDDEVHDSAVASAVVHPDYSLARKYHDIAVLELANPLRWSTNRIKPACLWQGQELDFKGRPTAIGWGTTTYPKFTMSEILLKGMLDIIPKQTCQGMLRPTKQFPRLTDELLCAMDLTGKPKSTVDTCQGDSGGPLLTNDSRDAGYDIPYIVGITSFGKTCGDGFPGIYTRVSSYVSWIESIVWPDNITLEAL